MVRFTIGRLKQVVVLVMVALLAGPVLAKPPEGKGGGNGKGGASDIAPPTFEWVALGTIAGGLNSHAESMNNLADIVGFCHVPSVGDVAFLNIDDGNGGRLMIDLDQKLRAEGLVSN